MTTAGRATITLSDGAERRPATGTPETGVGRPPGRVGPDSGRIGAPVGDTTV